jgi:hypothetical protein
MPLTAYSLASFVFGSEYECSTLDMIRKRLFLQSEASGHCTIEWGRRVDGNLTKDAFGETRCGMCDGAVQSALNEFRPLAFALAFKVQDVLAEAVLDASGTSGARDLSFGGKRKEIDKARSSGGLMQPEVLAKNPKISEAWWNLYFDLEPFRGAIHHSGTLIRDPDGGLKIITSRPKRLGGSLVLSAADQGSYVRIACLVAEAVASEADFDPLHRRLVANDVAALERLHEVSGASEGPARLERVKLIVAEEYAQATAPFACEIDFDDVAACAGAPLIDLEVEATVAGRTLTWSIPADSYPTGIRVLREGDPEFDQWRVS